MQVSYFSNGGFVIHKIGGLSLHKISAWYDVNGNLIDAEYIIAYASRDGALRVSKRHKHILGALNTIGRAHRRA